MSSSQNNDSDERFALGLVFALITLVVLSVLWFGAYKGIHGAKSAKGGVIAAKVQPGASGAVLGGTASAGSAAATGAGDAAAQAGAAAGASASAANGAAAQAGAAADDTARVLIENGIVKFYFATAKAELAAGANEALADVVKGVAEGKKAVVSGFHDATGDAALNAELAKQRAVAVAEALKALGVAEDKVELKKPEETTATGSNAEARRVEVTLGAL